MKIKDVLAKLGKHEDLTDEEKTFLADYVEPDVDKVANSRAAEARRDAEEKHNLTKEELEKLQKKLEEIDNSKLSDSEKVKKQIEELDKQLAAEIVKGEALEKKNTGLSRDHKIEKIMRTLRFVSGFDPESGKTLIANRLKDVDLDDKDAVAKVIEEFKAGNAALIAVDTDGGTGSDHTGDDGPTTKQTYTPAQIASMSPEDYQKHKVALKAAEAAGEIKT